MTKRRLTEGLAEALGGLIKNSLEGVEERHQAAMDEVRAEAQNVIQEALTEVQQEYDDEKVPGVKSGLGIALDAVRVVLNRHQHIIDIADDSEFSVGRRVTKKTGYEFYGTVVSVFTNRAGEIRLVVESLVIPGMLHIFSPTQMEVSS